MSWFKSTLIFMLVVIVTACGGNDSSTDDSSTIEDAEPSITYTGTQNLILSSDGMSETTQIDAFITISGDVILIDPLSANGSIADNNFVAISNRTSTYEGLTCQFLLTYRGSISEEALSANISGTAKCDETDDSQTQDVIGTVSAARNSG